VFKKSQNFNIHLASKKPNWQPCYPRIENAHKVRKKTFNFLLCIEVQKTSFSFSPAENIMKSLNASMLKTADFELVQQFNHVTEFGDAANTVSASADQP